MAYREDQNSAKIAECAETTRWAVRGWVDECDASNNKILIREAFRSYQSQVKAYQDYLDGKIAAAAPPGKSLHQRGLAVDISVLSGTLKKIVDIAQNYGIYQELPERDPCHFCLDRVQPPTPLNPPPAPTLSQLQNAKRWATGIRLYAILRAIKRLSGY